jgi:hypothetical protein
MKANGAPEKIYIVNDDLKKREWYKTQQVGFETTEYIRSDAFIEKACEFMCNNIDPQLTIYHDNTWRKRDEFIEKFKNYMEGE